MVLNAFSKDPFPRKWKDSWNYLIDSLVERAKRESGRNELDPERAEIVRDQVWLNLRGEESRDGKRNYKGGCDDARLQDRLKLYDIKMKSSTLYV